ncbi:MAG: cell wall hydrolase [Pseudomonadota bacterium]
MKASRKRPKGAFRRPFGLVLCVVTAMPNSIGHQDLAALIARQPAVTERWRAHVRNSAFGTIHAASLSFPRLVGASIPDPYFTQLAAIDPRALQATGSIPLDMPLDPVVAPPPYEFPTVDRRLKGDRLDVKAPPAEQPSRPQVRPKAKDMASRPLESEASPDDAPMQPQAEAAALQAALPKGDRTAPVQAVEAEAKVTAAPVRPRRGGGAAAAYLNQVRGEAKRLARAGRSVPAEPFETADLESQRPDLAGPVAPQPAMVADARAVAEQPLSEPRAGAAIAPVPNAENAAQPPAPDVAAAAPGEPDRAAINVADAKPEKSPDRFNPDAAEKLAAYAKPAAERRVYFGTHALGIGRNSWEAWDADETPTLLAPPHVDTEIKRAARDPVPDAEAETGGETIAPKGEVTGEGKRPRTPAERLNLTGASRAKHQKCLANAIYFEARGEVERGQMAVAQVVLNRVFSGYYPGNICDVVYQNAHRHLACQFTFACDNHRDVVRDQPRWELADRIASDALDGKFWLPEIGKATHYHATYVNPWWVRTMTKHSRIGVHIFYRPTRWGTLDEIPVWGDRLETTGSVQRQASPAAPEKKNDDKRADAQPAKPARRSIFDPVEPLDLPGG